MIRAWVLVLIMDGTTVDLVPAMTAPACQTALKKHVAQNPKQRLQIRCEWRNP